MLRAVARPLVNIVERWMPNALVFAIVLTFVVALMARSSPGDSVISSKVNPSSTAP